MKKQFYIFRLILPFFLLLSLDLMGQKSATDLQIEKYMTEAKSHMASGNWEEANLTFRKLLTIKAILPTEMCYYFAETLYHLRQYQNSKNFIDKYVKLTGTTGPYYSKLMALNKLVDERFKEIKECNLCDSKGYRLAECGQCSGEGHLHATCNFCKGKGITTCLACGGKGMKITENAFKEKDYKECHVCETKGVATCAVCEGLKTELITCTNCKGKGSLVSNKICHHSPTNSASSAELLPE